MLESWLCLLVALWHWVLSLTLLCLCLSPFGLLEQIPDWMAYKQHAFGFCSSGAWKCKSGMTAWGWCWWRCFSGPSSCLVFPSGSNKMALWGLSYPYAHILFRRAPSHDLITPERSHFLRPSHWSLQFQHVHFGGRTIVYSNRQSLHCVMGNPYYMSCEIMLASLAYTRDKQTHKGQYKFTLKKKRMFTGRYRFPF